MLKNHVYVSRSGLTAGLKRRGGFGFIPEKQLTPEHTFLQSLDLTGKTIYDIGGHIGLITLFLARKTGEAGRVVTFEPNPQNYQAILDHVKLNGFNQVTVIQMGLGRQQDTLKFVVAGASARGSAAADRQKQLFGQKGARTFQIEVDALDRLIDDRQLPRPDFVKIDVEGLELDVLHGMAHTIRTDRPQIHIELHGMREQEVVELLLSYGYKIYQIEDAIEINQQNLDQVHGHLYVH
jgi:FkbM family methyltransferase